MELINYYKYCLLDVLVSKTHCPHYTLNFKFIKYNSLNYNLSAKKTDKKLNNFYYIETYISFIETVIFLLWYFSFKFFHKNFGLIFPIY